MNEGLENVNKWLQVNGLKVNDGKSKYMEISSARDNVSHLVMDGENNEAMRGARTFLINQ